MMGDGFEKNLVRQTIQVNGWGCRTQVAVLALPWGRSGVSLRLVSVPHSLKGHYASTHGAEGRVP